MVRPRPSPAHDAARRCSRAGPAAPPPRAHRRAPAPRGCGCCSSARPRRRPGGTSTHAEAQGCALPAQGADVARRARGRSGSSRPPPPRPRRSASRSTRARELLAGWPPPRSGVKGSTASACTPSRPRRRRLLVEGHERGGRARRGRARARDADRRSGPPRCRRSPRAAATALRHQGLVPAVHAVEVPDRDGRARPAGSGGRVEPDDLHHGLRGLRLLEGKRLSRWSCRRSSSRRRPRALSRYPVAVSA